MALLSTPAAEQVRVSSRETEHLLPHSPLRKGGSPNTDGQTAPKMRRSVLPEVLRNTFACSSFSAACCVPARTTTYNLSASLL